MHLGMQSERKVWFPGGLCFRATSGAKAIYTGVLRDRRGDFWTTKGVEIMNACPEARELFRGHLEGAGLVQRGCVDRP